MNWEAADAGHEGQRGVEEAYAEYGGAVYRFALRLTGNVDDAEDIVVETFAEAYRRWDSYSGMGSRRAWLFGIAANRSREGRRRKRPVEALSDETRHSGPNVVDLIAIGQAISALPRRQRESFLLVKGEGLTAKEAAQSLGRPMGTVLYEVNRAVHAIRASLDVGDGRGALLETDL